MAGFPPGPTAAQPLVLASSYPPVPARLVDKIKSGKYVDMKEMLSDNISLLRSLEALHPAMHAGLNLAAPTKPRLRDVGDILTWAYCFMGYISIRTPDQATRDMLTYARLLIREARKHGGDGWKAYDTVFRENAAITPLTEWTKIEGSLHATTFVANRSGEGIFCRFCSESDHTAEDCAVGVLKQGLGKKTADTTPRVSVGRAEESRPGKWTGKGKFPMVQRSTPYSEPYKGTPGHICHSWNHSRCIFPNRCRLQHICASCFTRAGLQKEHPAKECPDAPLTGERPLGGQT